MPRRVNPDPSLDPVAFPIPILNEIYAHARETLPEECCGLIVGDARERHQEVIRCRNDMTQHHQRDANAYPRDGRQGFFMNENDYLAADRSASARGLQVTVVYHSHVDCGAYFSAMDQEFASRPLYPFPEADHLVVAIAGGSIKEQGVFRLNRESGRFIGFNVVSRP